MEDDESLWNKILTEENKQRVISSLEKKEEGSEEWPLASLRQSAVLVPLVLVDRTPSILFTVRSHHVSRHRNQVSFPGGLADTGDVSPAGTALREAEEELGIASRQVEVWGELPSLPDRRKTSVVTPVLGFVRDFSHSALRPNHAEVNHAFTLPIQHLANPRNSLFTRSRSIAFRFPVFLGGSRKIWGLTGFILDMALLKLVPSRQYHPISVSR